MKRTINLTFVILVLISTSAFGQTGSGNVFLTYPNAGSTNDTNVTLERLIGAQLNSNYVKTHNLAPGVATTAHGPVFDFTPLPDPNWDPQDNDQPCVSEPGITCPYTYDTYIHFDEVNVYYHIDKFRHNFINNLGTIGTLKVTANVNVRFGQGGGDVEGTEAWYNPTNNELYFGSGNGAGANNFARDYKVIYHEYFHAIHDHMNASSIGNGVNEEGFITEGLADYFAGAFTNTPKIMEYVFDVPFPLSDIRDMNAPQISHYSNIGQATTVHEGGEFFSSVLWDLRNDSNISSKSDIDKVVFGAMDNLDSSPTFEEFMDEMLERDVSSNSGSNLEEIHNAFNDAGIYSPTYLDPAISQSTTISGTKIVHKNVNVTGSAVLTIAPGTTIQLKAGRHISIQPGSRLHAVGSQSNPITFERKDTGSKWGDINLRSSSGNRMEWVLVDGGDRNIDITSANNTLKHVTSRNGWRGISGYTNADGGGRASATLEYCLIENNTSVGIVAWIMDMDISYTTIQNNAQAGIYLYQSQIYPFHHNFVGNNGLSTGRVGIEITSSGALYMHSNSYGRGYNKIYNNGDDELSTSGTLVIGQIYPGSGGYNEIYDYWGGTDYLVDNNSGVTVKGYYSHYGAGSSPQPGMFDGSVNTYGYLTTDPTLGVIIGHNGQAPTKHNPFSDPKVSEEGFIDAYTHIESTLGESGSSEDPRQSLTDLFQISRVSENEILRNEFRNFILPLANGNLQLFEKSENNKIARNSAQILYLKTLMHSGQYEDAKIFLNSIKSDELERYEYRDYLHFKLSLEILDSKYEDAWNTLQKYYAFEESSGEDIEEVKAINSIIEFEILSNLNGSVPEPMEAEKGEFKIDLVAYPNPFNPSTTISFTLDESSDVTLKVFDLLGREIAVLVNGRMEVGKYSVRFDAVSLSSGVYIYQLQAGDRILSKKITLLK